MPTEFPHAVERYARARNLAEGTRREYAATVRKWKRWGDGSPIEELTRRHIREFLDWVHAAAVEEDGINPGRTANKARDHLRAVVSWAWEQDLIEALPRFPKKRPQRDVAGRQYLTKSELNSLYFATYSMRRPRGWKQTTPVGRYWRAALVLFFNYGLDTGTVWQGERCHEPLRWRHVCWDRQSPSGESKERSRWGWMFYRRVKTGKTFHRPMNRVVHAHLKSIMPENPEPDAFVFDGGGARPNRRFRELTNLAGIRPKIDPESGEQRVWSLKDLRNACA